MSEPRGALFFWKDEPHITGYLVIGEDHYQLAGVRTNDIRADFTGKKISRTEQQTDLFDDLGSGDGASECDSA